MTNNQTDDNQLIEQYLKGNEQALETLISRYLRPMYSFIYQKVGSAADAQDISQEVFLKVWKNIKKFDPKKKFKPWLFQIAKNTCIDYLRKKKSIPFSRFENDKGQNVLLETLVSPSHVNLLDTLHNKAAFAVLTKDLSGHERQIIQLRHTQGMTFREIASVCEESINTIKSRYRRILKHMRLNKEAPF